MAVRNKNGRKRAEKFFALYAPFSYYFTFLLKPIKVVSNKQVIRGHSTGANQTIVASSLTDLFLLTRSSNFIGVKRSGFSRVAMGISNPKRAKLIPV